MTKAVWFPSQELIESTRLYRWMQKMGFSDYEQFCQATVRDIGWFWGEVDKELGIEWVTPYESVVNLSAGIQWPDWFSGGRINVVHNAIGKWAANPSTAEQVALIWEGDDGAVRRFSYVELQERVRKVAYGLRQMGIQQGDRISIYMPMIPETVIAMLAIAHIGAMFSPAFSGYGADAVAKRAEASEAKLIITADGFLRRGKIVAMKEEADRAADLAPSVEKVVVVRRLGRDLPWNDARDVDWSTLENQPDEALIVAPTAMDSNDPLMLLYTSGTTGRPKGAVHTHAGFPIKAAFDAGIGMDVQAGDRLFWITDMGWMMGPFLIFGALINGATAVIYEGSPDYPEPNRLWKLVEDHRVTHLGISPTLIRSLMKHGESWAQQHDLSSLRAIASTGEPWNEEPWGWLFEKIGHSRIPIINYSGGTEIAGGILGNVLIKPISPITFNTPLPGMDVAVYNAAGEPVHGEVGELVIRNPWVGMTQGFWKDPKRYEDTYWSRWPDIWVHGDWAIIDEEGFWTITGRSDDTLNVAGKRVGPAEVESILVGHPAVLEAGAIGVPDEIKGEVVVCFAVLKPGYSRNEELDHELLDLVAEKLGKALRPKAIHVVADLPKTRNGKVLRRAMRAAYLDRDAGDLSSLENPDAVEGIRQIRTLQS